jgi:hypothetical protein
VERVIGHYGRDPRSVSPRPGRPCAGQAQALQTIGCVQYGKPGVKT